MYGYYYIYISYRNELKNKIFCDIIEVIYMNLKILRKATPMPRLYSTLPSVENPKNIAWINLDNLKNNYKKLASVTPAARHICVIKADAYGHGANECAEALLSCGCDFFAVSSIEEATSLRLFLRTITAIENEPDILILGFTPVEYAHKLAELNIIQAGISFGYCATLAEAAKLAGVCVKVHIKLDTGMNRVGFVSHSDKQADETARDILELSKLKNLNICGMFSHFAKSDEDESGAPFNHTERQYSRYMAVKKNLEAKGFDIGFCHICNSAGNTKYPEYQLDGVRLGIMLYGYNPIENMEFQLEPVMELQSLISHIHTMEAGEELGYGGTYIAEGTRRIATIPIGYADGFFRMYKGSTVQIKTRSGNYLAKLVGRVCMDQCMVDITDIPDARELDRVSMFGYEAGTLETIAKNSGFLEYEIVCGVSSRVERRYIWESKE